MLRLATIAAASAVAVAAAAAAPGCFVTINDVTAISSFAQVIEGPCFSTIYSLGPPSPFPVTFRSYPRDAVMLVEASISDDPGNTFQENVFFTSSFVFGFIGGEYNAGGTNLSSARTAPFILRPLSAERTGDLTWVGAMALAPSVFPAGSSPPAPTLSNILVRPFGVVVI